MLDFIIERIKFGASVFVASLISVAAIFFVFYFFQDQIPSQQLSLKSPAIEQQPQIEEIFLNGLSGTPAKSSEWWQARSDHRLLAQAIFHCKNIDGITMTSMPREHYRTLLMDLTPDGDHLFRANSADTASLALIEKTAKAFRLTGAEHDFLALSDSIGRARISAADGASVNVPWVQRLGIASVVISALATLFVTLQGRIRPVEMDDEGRKEFLKTSFGSRAKIMLIGPGASFRWVAFFAIALSITGTSLAGLKQVYDPTRTLTQNTRALLELRQLHQEVVLSAKCSEDYIVLPEKMANWAATLRRVRATVVPDYGAYASLDFGSNSRQEPTSDERPIPLPKPAPALRNPKPDQVDALQGN